MSRAADVYSYSMIMWELFACKRLYEGHIASQVIFQAQCLVTMPISNPGVCSVQLRLPMSVMWSPCLQMQQLGMLSSQTDVLVSIMHDCCRSSLRC